MGKAEAIVYEGLHRKEDLVTRIAQNNYYNYIYSILLRYPGSNILRLRAYFQMSLGDIVPN